MSRMLIIATAALVALDATLSAVLAAGPDLGTVQRQPLNWTAISTGESGYQAEVVARAWRGRTRTGPAMSRRDGDKRMTPTLPRVVALLGESPPTTGRP